MELGEGGVGRQPFGKPKTCPPCQLCTTIPCLPALVLGERHCWPRRAWGGHAEEWTGVRGKAEEREGQSHALSTEGLSEPASLTIYQNAQMGPIRPYSKTVTGYKVYLKWVVPLHTNN